MEESVEDRMARATNMVDDVRKQEKHGIPLDSKKENMFGKSREPVFAEEKAPAKDESDENYEDGFDEEIDEDISEPDEEI